MELNELLHVKKIVWHMCVQCENGWGVHKLYTVQGGVQCTKGVQ